MYVITGATGHTGSIVADNLLAKGEKVRVIGRDPKRLERFVSKGAEAFPASVEDVSALTNAFNGARAVYAMVPPSNSDPNPRQYQERVTDALAEAVHDAHVPYVVMLSSIGADKADKTGPILGLHSFEQKLNGVAGLNALYLRATYFLENFLPQIDVIRAMGFMAGGLAAGLKLPMIATRDIGAYAAEALVRANVSGKSTQELLGAEDVSSSQAASVIGKAIGRPELSYIHASKGQLKPALMRMMPEAMADLILE